MIGTGIAGMIPISPCHGEWDGITGAGDFHPGTAVGTAHIVTGAGEADGVIPIMPGMAVITITGEVVISTVKTTGMVKDATSIPVLWGVVPDTELPGHRLWPGAVLP